MSRGDRAGDALHDRFCRLARASRSPGAPRPARRGRAPDRRTHDRGRRGGLRRDPTVDELPHGVTADQAPGRYRLERRAGDRLFDYVIGPTAWKRFTFPPRVPLTVGRRDGGAVSFSAVERPSVAYAFLGVRACELAALGIQDRVLKDGPAVDADYAARRSDAFIVAVECVTAATTCFCTSMGTGPEVRGGFDVALTELDDGFVVRAGSPAGTALLERLPLTPADAEHRAAATAAVAATRRSIGDPVDTDGLPARLLANLDNPHWAEIADRCLACANCTLVCPTCFCTSVGQRSDLDGQESPAERSWDSCFTAGFARWPGEASGRASRTATGSGSPTSSRPGGTSSGAPAASAAAAASRGARSASMSATSSTPSPDRARDARRRGHARGRPSPPDRGARAARAASRARRSRPAAGARRPGPDRADLPKYGVCRVASTRAETPDTTTLVLTDVDPAIVAGRPGQFVMASLPAFSAAPISISRYRPDGIELTIRAAGPATTRICASRRDDQLGLRGPLGRSWPVERRYGRDVAIVTGGIGLAPLRPLLDAILAERDKFGAVRLFYGARTPGDRLFVEELDASGAGGDLEVALDGRSRRARSGSAGSAS